uniref:Uncharacterized protein n=1 Tax=Nicotiana tabacum TaxID=4097 RepID=A0A1S4CTD0_TOBAC|nr:PREDICTED: uncharacterized protein LOC107822358 [Nicotiana tabacum]
MGVSSNESFGFCSASERRICTLKFFVSYLDVCFRTLLTISPTGLEPSRECSECITNSFKHEINSNGINWKSVSDETKRFYFGEFKIF